MYRPWTNKSGPEDDTATGTRGCLRDSSALILPSSGHAEIPGGGSSSCAQRQRIQRSCELGRLGLAQFRVGEPRHGRDNAARLTSCLSSLPMRAMHAGDGCPIAILRRRAEQRDLEDEASSPGWLASASQPVFKSKITDISGDLLGCSALLLSVLEAVCAPRRRGRCLSCLCRPRLRLQQVLGPSHLDQRQVTTNASSQKPGLGRNCRSDAGLHGRGGVPEPARTLSLTMLRTHPGRGGSFHGAGARRVVAGGGGSGGSAAGSVSGGGSASSLGGSATPDSGDGQSPAGSSDSERHAQAEPAKVQRQGSHPSSSGSDRPVTHGFPPHHTMPPLHIPGSLGCGTMIAPGRGRRFQSARV